MGGAREGRNFLSSSLPTPPPLPIRSTREPGTVANLMWLQNSEVVFSMQLLAVTQFKQLNEFTPH